MTRRLVATISTSGKTADEVKAAARQALQQYLRARPDDGTGERLTGSE